MAKTDGGGDDLDDVWPDWQRDVNMTASELETWLDTDESRSVGDTHTEGGSGGESTGHKSGRRIVKLLRTNKGDLTSDDVAWMRKVVGYVARHTAQRPSGDITDTPWRYSLMNWGHDPRK
jgi:hypothetical protein